MKIEIKPIGWVKSSRSAVQDDHWDRESVEIELDASIPDEAIMGLESFSHLEVIFFMDQAEDIPPSFSRHPRGNQSWPRVGIFSQRVKDRPNRLGLSRCRIKSVSGRRVQLEGLDAVDGTPVIDLKPWVQGFGPRGPVREPAWMTELMLQYWD